MYNLLLFTLLPALLASCGTVRKPLSWNPFKKKAAPEEVSQKDLYLGVVEIVNPEQRFVLIKADTRMVFPAGTRLETRSKTGSKALLTLTPERKQSFVSADIKEGFPQAGDAVVIPFSEPGIAAAMAPPPVQGGTQLNPSPNPNAPPPAPGAPLPALPANYEPVPGQLPDENPAPGVPQAAGGRDALPPPIR